MITTSLLQAIKDKGYTINSLSKEIGMSHVGLANGINKGILKVETLEKILDVLDIPIAHFFEGGKTEMEQIFEADLMHSLTTLDVIFELYDNNALLPITMNTLKERHLEIRKKHFD